MKIDVVLFLPVAGDPAGILACGPFGGRPPFVVPPCPPIVAGGARMDWRPSTYGPAPGDALPIWWDRLVPDGYDRVRRLIPGWTDWPPDPTPHGGASYIVRMAQVYGTSGMGRLLCFARDSDGWLVEVG